VFPHLSLIKPNEHISFGAEFAFTLLSVRKSLNNKGSPDKFRPILNRTYSAEIPAGLRATSGIIAYQFCVRNKLYYILFIYGFSARSAIILYKKAFVKQFFEKN